ncbi:hypothetical protein HRH25_09895 [Flavisolibacter sp. BT320]|nr:hypothetical protein [Flavisolibacter longurius]
MMDISVVIGVNKRDLWLCRICVASIRYYYPDVKIYLLKDELNGKFSTKEVEKNWNVEQIKYPVKRFGWGAAKMHFFCDQRFAERKFLVLDSDIVITGRILDEPFLKRFDQDIIISEEYPVNPNSKWFTQTYFDYDVIRSHDPDFTFGGFTFNTGQIFCKGSFLDPKIVEPYFNFNGMPSWKRMDLFPLVDQSVLNYVLPQQLKSGNIRIGRQSFMLWSETDRVKGLSLDEIKSGESLPFVIHWAGAFRTPLLGKMTRGDILSFFEKKYYEKIFGGAVLRYTRRIKPFIIYQMRKVYHQIKQNLTN